MDWKKYKGRGMEFLFSKTDKEIFTWEELTQDHLLFYETTLRFIKEEVEPVVEEIDGHKQGLLRSLLRKAGELGLLAPDSPEEYGGLALDKTTTMVITEAVSYGLSGAFTAAYGAHTGIGTLPILFFGTEAQKRKYLTKLITGEYIGCYALTEAGSGSDALSIKTKAKLSDDGRYYILNGEKMFITNSGFADIAIVFAKVDGKDFSCFIVEMGQEGVSTGAEENKMGIKGSSTRTLILEDVKVPVENLLYKIGEGHVIAFNVLNVGRYKLGIGCLGGIKRLIKECSSYAKERKQFGRSISDFRAIREKIAKMALLAFSLESIGYRVAGLIDGGISEFDKSSEDYQRNVVEVIKEFAIEASIMKVFGSEALDISADEAVQLFGGYGYIHDYIVERAYRDSRINRIFEGTNEINRLLIPGMILRRSMKGEVPLMKFFFKVRDELDGKEPSPKKGEGLWDEYRFISDMVKRGVVYIFGNAVQRYMAKLKEPEYQLILMRIADMIIETFKIDSVVLRGEKFIKRFGEERGRIVKNLVTLQLYRSLEEIERLGEEVIVNIMPEDRIDITLSNFKKLIPEFRVNTFKLIDSISEHILSREKYSLY